MSNTDLQYERNRYSKLRNDLRQINQKLANSINSINNVISGMENYYVINDNKINIQELKETKEKIQEIQNNINNIVLPGINEKINTLDGDIQVMTGIAS